MQDNFFAGHMVNEEGKSILDSKLAEEMGSDRDDDSVSNPRAVPERIDSINKESGDEDDEIQDIAAVQDVGAGTTKEESDGGDNPMDSVPEERSNPPLTVDTGGDEESGELLNTEPVEGEEYNFEEQRTETVSAKPLDDGKVKTSVDSTRYGPVKLILLCLTVAISALATGLILGLDKEETSTKTLSFATSSPTPIGHTGAPSNLPTFYLEFDPPSPDECRRIANGHPLMNKEAQILRNFEIQLDISLSENISTVNTPLLGRLDTAMQQNMATSLAGCDEVDYKGGRKRLRRRLLRKNVVSNAVFKTTFPDTDEPCLPTSLGFCYRAVATIELYLKGDESISKLLGLITDALDHESLMNTLGLDPPISNVVFGAVKSIDPIESPTQTPTLQSNDDDEFQEGWDDFLGWDDSYDMFGDDQGSDHFGDDDFTGGDDDDDMDDFLLDDDDTPEQDVSTGDDAIITDNGLIDFLLADDGLDDDDVTGDDSPEQDGSTGDDTIVDDDGLDGDELLDDDGGMWDDDADDDMWDDDADDDIWDDDDDYNGMDDDDTVEGAVVDDSAPQVASISEGPTLAPTSGCTLAPTSTPTYVPTLAPTITPTSVPSLVSTSSQSVGTTVVPTLPSTTGPTTGPTLGHSSVPTVGDTNGPTVGLTVGLPSGPKSGPTSGYTSGPTSNPSSGPTAGPTYRLTSGPTFSPTSGVTDQEDDDLFDDDDQYDDLVAANDDVHDSGVDDLTGGNDDDRNDDDDT